MKIKASMARWAFGALLAGVTALPALAATTVNTIYGGTASQYPLNGTYCTSVCSTNPADVPAGPPNEPSKAFDQDNSTYWMAGYLSGATIDPNTGESINPYDIPETTGILVYNYPTYTLVDQFSIVPRASSSAPKTWTFDGWDGTKWITLGSYTNTNWSAGTATSFQVAYPKYCLKYRLRITANNGGAYLQIAELQLQSHSPLTTAATNLQPWLRYYGNNHHYYTSNTDELGTGRNGFSLEGIEGYVWTSQQAGTVPLYKYSNGSDYFYTTNYNDLGAGYGGYTYKGIAAYAYNQPHTGAVLLHRFYNGNDHFYSLSATVPSGYTEEKSNIWVSAIRHPLGSNVLFDFSGDRKADLMVWRPSSATWYLKDPTQATVFGSSTVVPVTADFDGDGISDIGYWVPSTGVWQVTLSSNGGNMSNNWGSQSVGDVPVPADYDGDGRADIAVWRSTTAQWFHIRSSDGVSVGPVYGQPGDKPAVGDYDGDGKADFGVWRPSTGEYWMHHSSDGSSLMVQFGGGSASDLPIPGDYDGDGKTDAAIWRANTGMWVIYSSSAHSILGLGFDISPTAIPVPADYDGDGITDFATWDSSTGIWHIQYSSGLPDAYIQWGTLGDIPAPTMLRH